MFINHVATWFIKAQLQRIRNIVPLHYINSLID